MPASTSLFFQKIQTLDKLLTSFFYHLLPHSFPFQKFFESLAPTGVTTFLWIIIFFALIVFEEKKHKKFLPYFVLSLSLAFLFSNLIFKPLFARQRPTNNFLCPKDYSFPSGHASLSFASALTLAYFDKKRKLFYYSFAALISYSRIYLGCHWFFDVVAGAVLGIVIGKVITRRIINKS